MQTLPTFNPHPAGGDLGSAVLIMADRMAHAQVCAALARTHGVSDDAARLDKVAGRRSRALARLVDALTNTRTGGTK